MNSVIRRLSLGLLFLVQINSPSYAFTAYYFCDIEFDKQLLYCGSVKQTNIRDGTSRRDVSWRLSDLCQFEADQVGLLDIRALQGRSSGVEKNRQRTEDVWWDCYSEARYGRQRVMKAVQRECQKSRSKYCQDAKKVLERLKMSPPGNNGGPPQRGRSE